MTSRTPVIGVLGLQGDYQKHQRVLDAIGITSFIVRTAADLDRINRLIIPGGESTVIFELLNRLEMSNKLKSFLKTRPVWGTCAGMILLASEVTDHSITPYGAIDITVDRNGYGRQFYSTVLPAELNFDNYHENISMVFIRAPRVIRAGRSVETLLSRDGDPVLLRQKNILVSSFHPELTPSTFLHNYFVRDFVSA